MPVLIMVRLREKVSRQIATRFKVAKPSNSSPSDGQDASIGYLSALSGMTIRNNQLDQSEGTMSDLGTHLLEDCPIVATTLGGLALAVPSIPDSGPRKKG